MARRLRLVWLGALLLGVGGCAAQLAGDRLEIGAARAEGRLLLVEQRDFADADIAGGRPSRVGSAMLRDAVVADRGIARFVRRHGLPDAIVLGPHAATVELAYLREGKLHTLQIHGLTIVPRAWHASTVIGVRPLTEAEVDQIEPERRFERRVELLRRFMESYGRVRHVGRRLVLALPPEAAGESPGYDYGFFTVDVLPESARLFGQEDDGLGVIVGGVDADGPAAGRLEVGDRITRLGAAAVPTAPALPVNPGQTQHLTITRAGTTQAVSIVAERWPREVEFILVPHEVPNAFAAEQAIGITTAMVRLAETDDELAVVLGHELAHLTLRHVRQGPTVGRVLEGAVGLGVLFPVELALRGAGQLLGQVLQGVENRFNRDQEREADRLGVRYAYAAGYRPEAAITVIRRLEQEAPAGTVAQFFDSHPPYPERVVTVERTIAELTPARPASR